MPTRTPAVPLLPALHPGPAWALAALASGGAKLMGIVLLGEMGTWFGHVGQVCWCVRGGGTRAGQRCCGEAQTRSTGCVV